jgi:hypothetical protein
MKTKIVGFGDSFVFGSELANNNDGFATTLGNIKRIVDSINKKAHKTIIKNQEKSIDIIDLKWLFLLALVLLSTEWILRKYWMAQ